VKKQRNIPLGLVRAAFWYDEDGYLIWRARKDVPFYINTRLEGVRAGTRAPSLSGYHVVIIDGGPHQLHRIIWAYHNGPIPEGIFIDHIDGNKSNNKIDNLRAATPSQNGASRKGLPSHNTSGFVGVSRSKGKWQAQIGYQGKYKYIGTFENKDDAARARDAAAIKAHGEFAYLNLPTNTPEEK